MRICNRRKIFFKSVESRVFVNLVSSVLRGRWSVELSTLRARGRKIEDGCFFRLPLKYLITVYNTNNISLFLFRVLRWLLWKCNQSIINSFIFWSIKSASYLWRLLTFKIVPGRWGNVTLVYLFPLVLHASHLIHWWHTSVWSRNGLIGSISETTKSVNKTKLCSLSFLIGSYIFQFRLIYPSHILNGQLFDQVNLGKYQWQFYQANVMSFSFQIQSVTILTWTRIHHGFAAESCLFVCWFVRLVNPQ